MPLSRPEPDAARTVGLRPAGIPFSDWISILRRVLAEVRHDRLTLVAAGVSFYLMLATFPALAALASIYGLFTDASLLDRQLAALSGFAPESVVELLRRQLETFIRQSPGRFELGLVVGVVVAVAAVNRGVSTLFMAMNIVYEEEETRSWPHKLVVTLAFSVGILTTAGLWVFILGFAQLLLSPLGMDAATASRLRWPLLLGLAGLCVVFVYRYGPCRDPARRRWLTWGAVLATAVWFAGSAVFSWWLERFGTYDATYGSLAAVAGLMIWIWLSAFVLLLGAELNAQIERRARQRGATEESGWSGT